MNRIQKALQRLSEKERRVVKDILEGLHSNHTEGLDVKKLKGMRGVFRVRKGDIRIIFCLEDSEITILKIDRRSDTTYTEW